MVPPTKNKLGAVDDGSPSSIRRTPGLGTILYILTAPRDLR